MLEVREIGKICPGFGGDASMNALLPQRRVPPGSSKSTEVVGGVEIVTQRTSSQFCRELMCA